ncbi:MAG: Hsp20/alpha crystallin family protein [Anaerolineae bacterium]|jgi:HSP20 family protein|nr:Hsp20/alpha crystallin family protein [Anaerolineae bacterium]
MTWRMNRSFTPPTDIIELPDRLRVMVEIAGVQPDDLNLTLLNRVLVISGTRRRPPIEGHKAYHQLEIGFGEFRIEIPLPWSIEQEEVFATYHDGFLQVDLPRRAETHIYLIETVTNADSTEGQSDGHQ